MLTRVRRRPVERGPDDDPTLLASSSWLMASRLVQAVLGWAGTVLIARSLSIEEFGRFTLIFSLLGMLSVVTDMGTGRLAVRGMLERGDDDEAPTTAWSAADEAAGGFAGTYLVLRTAMGLAGYVLVLVVVTLLGYPDDVVRATAVAGLVVVLATPAAALEVVFQARLRLGTVNAAGVGGLLAQVALTAAIASAGGSLLLFTIPAVLCQVVILVWSAAAVRRLVPLRPHVDLTVWRSLLREAVPLTLGIGLATLYYRVDAVMLSRLDTFEAVGIYGVSYKFVDVVHFGATAVTIPLLTVLVRSWPDDLAAFRDGVRRGAMLLALFGGTALVGILGFAGPLTALLYGSAYAVGQDATRLLVAGQVLTFFASLALTCLIAVARHRTYPLVMLGGLALNVGANLVLIPRWSYEGAAVATLGSEVVVLAVLVLLVRRVPGAWPPGLGRLAVAPLAVAAGVASGWAGDQVLPWVLAAAVAVAAYLAVAVAGGLTTAAGVVRGAR